jgi:hypothetical protein
VKLTLTDWPLYVGDIETLYDINCEVTPYDPGVTNRAPEHCYPPEGGTVEIESVFLGGLEIPYEHWDRIGLDKKERERIGDAAWEKADELAAADEGLAEDAYDAKRDHSLDQD